VPNPLSAGMARLRRHAFLNGDLEPTPTTTNGDQDARLQVMRELRSLTNSVAGAYLARDDRIFSIASMGRLSRADIAQATGLHKSRVDQIVREMAERYAGEYVAPYGAGRAQNRTSSG
jgi:hypothetical protein